MGDDLQYYRNQVSLARTEIKNLRQQLASLKHEHLNEIQHIKTALNRLQCGNCTAEATTIHQNNENAESQPTLPAGTINYQPIGYIETSFHNKRGVPRQPSVLASAHGVVVIHTTVFNNPEHALSGLEEFSHMWIIFHFHVKESTNTPAKISPPRLQGERRGVFSTRSPHRPCSIGLSLVKIVKVEGNKVYFQGVDMVNGTPVLDLKPFIPQYDYPLPEYGEVPISSVDRPPTEGVNDVTDSIASVGLTNIADRLNLNSVSDGTSTSQSPTFNHNNLSPNPQVSLVTPESPSETNDPFPRSPIHHVGTERGAPDGQERFTPPQSANNINSTQNGIRVAPWISNPPQQKFQVRFTDDALARLNELIGDRANSFKSNIESLLSEDPRSNYVRTRYPTHEYSCVLEDLSISCVFDNATSLCSIIAIRSSEELQ